ncbi:MAG: rod shape-determining protein MreC, partial [Oscillochloris sp.]|nr:rod shape-determining protein MreC [Oscillochloris sp.]
MRDYLDDRPIKLRRDRSNVPASLRPFLLAGILILLSVLLLTLDSLGYLTPARSFAELVLTPLAQPLTGVRDALAEIAAVPRGEQTLRARIGELEAENADLRAEVLRREQAQIENVALRQQLAIEQIQPWKLLGAEVAVRSPDAGRRVITIARGSDDEVQVGMAVIGQTPGGPAALIGIVESVTQRSAAILLIT